MSDEVIIRPNRNGVPSIKGTRLTVYSIMDHYFAGASLTEISSFYRITEAEAAGAVDYINSHMAELMPAYREMIERDAQGNPAGVSEVLAETHGKLIELRAELQGNRGRTEDASVAG